MTVGAIIRRAGTRIALPVVLVLVSGLANAAPQPNPSPETPSIAQLHERAETAEKSGDWETAFSTYCHLLVADRGSPDVRKKLNIALRRVQQLRRHRDPQFQQFVAGVSVADAMKLFTEVLTKVPVVYVDRDQATPQILWENGIEELDRALASPAFREAFLDRNDDDRIEGFRTALRISWSVQPVATAADAKLLLRKLTTAAQASFTVRVPAALILEMVCGSCGGLDEYTVFLNPTQFHADSTSAPPDLTAHGLFLGDVDGALTITGIVPGSWVALHTPLQRGDQIARVNGRDTNVASPGILAEALRNPINGFHELETVPETPDHLPLIARLPVVVPTVYGTDLVPEQEGIGYTRIGSITTTTPQELDDAIIELKNRGVGAVVIDLRGNMGGSFLAGVATAKRLIPAGVIVTTQGQVRQVDNRDFTSDSGATAHDIPVVVLVDTETASAAEVFVAALKDHNRATVVGMPTFGKGAIQYPMRLDSLDEKDAKGRPKTHNSGGVRLTIAKLVSPNGSPINGMGVSPHILEAHPDRQVDLAVEKATELRDTLSASMPPMPMPIMP